MSDDAKSLEKEMLEAFQHVECTLSNLLSDAKQGRPFGPYAVKGLSLALDRVRQAEARLWAVKGRALGCSCLMSGRSERSCTKDYFNPNCADLISDIGPDDARAKRKSRKDSASSD